MAGDRYGLVDCVRLGRFGAIATLLALVSISALSSPALGAPGQGRSRRCVRTSSFREGHPGSPSSGQQRDCRDRAPRRHGGCPDATLMPTSQNVEAIRTATRCLVNRERAAHGESLLRGNAHLERAAQAHTESMAFGDYFDHIGPGGQTPLARMRASGYIYSSRLGYEVGENIAWGTLWLATPKAIVAAWMASPGHRANILDPHFRETAIGVSPHPPSSLAHGQPGGIYTQDFGVIVR
jgi:uncharacterized protein YkwD